MPSRTFVFDTVAGVAQLNNGHDVVITPAGVDIVEVTIQTLPSTASGLVGLRCGQNGDAVRLNLQGQSFELSGFDRQAGLYLVWMGTSISPPTGIVEFVLGYPDHLEHES